MENLYDIPLRRIDGTSAKLGDYAGKVLLVVNVASKCGLTPQYDGLEKLYASHREKGLVVLGFPANEFLAQEPGTNGEIADFCRSTYGVDFPMFEKIVVKGPGQHPLYRALTHALPEAQQKPGSPLAKKLAEKGLASGAASDIQWNFEKFLIDRQGRVAARFAPDVTPDDPRVVAAIERALAATP